MSMWWLAGYILIACALLIVLSAAHSYKYPWREHIRDDYAAAILVISVLWPVAVPVCAVGAVAAALVMAGESIGRNLTK